MQSDERLADHGPVVSLLDQAASRGRQRVGQIVVCDHPYGSLSPSLCFQSDLISSALAAAQAYGSDVVGVSAMDVTSIGLTDTTFVAAGGDRRWIAFGEGNTGTTPANTWPSSGARSAAAATSPPGFTPSAGPRRCWAR